MTALDALKQKYRERSIEAACEAEQLEGTDPMADMVDAVLEVIAADMVRLAPTYHAHKPNRLQYHWQLEVSE